MLNHECKTCRGSGVLFEQGARFPCPDCNGEGEINVCPECKTALVADAREIEIGMCAECAAGVVCVRCRGTLYETDIITVAEETRLCADCRSELSRRRQ